ncbi:amidohydrolase [bacterium]|nr:MAG: amidohydrolase [bacterium]
MIRSAIRDILPDITEIRRDLHAHPELGYQEERTAGVVRRELAASGVQFVEGLAKGTGTLGYLPATRPGGRCIALRADMDALPIVEETGLPYASQNSGRMHACGHDGHTSMLIGAARVLARQEDRANDVLFMFQPAEEGGAGGMRMVEDGSLDGSRIGRAADAVYGLHGFPNADVGHFTSRPGPLMASASSFEIVVYGRGAHAAYPHVGIDPIVVTAHLVTALQTVASRTIGPLENVVVTVGKIDAGVAHNVIPEKARMWGTLRTLDAGVEARAKERLESIVTHTALAFGAEAEMIWGDNPYPAVVNDPAATDRFFSVARNTFGDERIHLEPEPSMGGEDFSFYGLIAPACFFFLGIRPPGQEHYANLHSPVFDFNDAALPYGMEALVALANEG